MDDVQAELLHARPQITVRGGLMKIGRKLSQLFKPIHAIAGIAAILLAFVPASGIATYPEKPITVVAVAYAEGGGSDW